MRLVSCFLLTLLVHCLYAQITQVSWKLSPRPMLVWFWAHSHCYTIRYPTNPVSILSFRAKAFHAITIYILFSTDVESAQLVLKLDIVHLIIHAIWMSDRWPPCILPSGLAKPRPVLRASYWVDVHIREKGFRTRRLSCEMMVQLSFR